MAASMDSDTLEALCGSIAKWEAIAAGTGMDLGQRNCPLCQKFYNEGEEDEGSPCSQCPVALAVNDFGCNNTPYSVWSDHRQTHYTNNDRWFGIVAGCDECKRLAQAELDFLKSLLPSDA